VGKWRADRSRAKRRIIAMERILEPELMEEDEQARAYAEADFEEPHNHFVEVLGEFLAGEEPGGWILDLGCGPGDITFRFARAYPACRVHGVDGSAAMLKYGRLQLARDPALARRVELFQGVLPEAALPRPHYDLVFSNSLLHHLRDPRVLWDSVKRFTARGAPVFIMDLMRPPNPEVAKNLVETHAADEPEILKRDFYNSLLAAFEVGEIEVQLEEAGLSHFSVRVVSDRHLVVGGRMREPGSPGPGY
jgi:SAM-dependent methyltransferase